MKTIPSLTPLAVAGLALALARLVAHLLAPRLLDLREHFGRVGEREALFLAVEGV